MATILIVDDDPSTRLFLEALLLQEGHRVIEAENGEEALTRLEQTGCDLVLMDIQMPVMDGYVATRRIKARSQGDALPILFLTSVQTDRELARCLECGGDDFLNKPPNPIILKARIQAWLQRADLANQLARDRQDVEKVILKMRRDDQFDLSGLRVLMTPLEKTNGDIVLSARRSDGVHYLMVGDFTGHGLAAAICGPLVADIFYRLTHQAVALGEILQQINETIFRRLPVDMFLVAAFVELDRAKRRMRVWNAALPPVTVVCSGRTVARLASTLPPLGIKGGMAVDTSGATYTLTGEERIYLFSDGSVETRSPDGGFFGAERLEAFLESLSTSGAGLESLLPNLATFRCEGEQSDDITLVEMKL
ncbi:MAG: fused response regulator/phosphatase [Magnetococcales bacterium]|nr:fused response regulator/phosphatase [Magnetococcales bacterium]